MPDMAAQTEAASVAVCRAQTQAAGEYGECVGAYCYDLRRVKKSDFQACPFVLVFFIPPWRDCLGVKCSRTLSLPT